MDIRGLLIRVAALTALLALPARAQTAPAPSHLEIKYVRDSEEYWTLVQQVYRSAHDAVLRAKDSVSRGAPWAVVVDVDETTLDNSVYQLEVSSYGASYPAGWDAWVRRMQAPAIPSAVEFLRAVRDAGGRVAFLSNRADSLSEPTRRNLVAAGLWSDHDLLCLESTNRAYTKAARRDELRRGSGACAWEGQHPVVLVYVGDQMVDFPAPNEEHQNSGGLAEFGVRYFLLPDPLYGTWTNRVTRPID